MAEIHTVATKRMALAVIATLALAGCNARDKEDPLAGGGGLSGQWRSSDNVFTAQLQDGAFQATANDTGSLISEGSYVVLSTTEVRLSWRGTITGQENSAVCSRPDIGTLNCRDAAGKTFTLLKS